jgi:hypothetical protein
MANIKISALTTATTPLAGTEVLPVVQSGATTQVSVANLTVGRSVSMSANTISFGNLTFSSTGQRITGDFNNATITNRVLFQNTTVNDNTIVGTMPNGTATIAGFVAYALSTPANSSTLDLLVRNDAANAVQIRSNRQGTGTFLPMQFFTNGGKKFEIDTSGNSTVTSAAGLGYSTGAGGTVTQGTSRTTAVTLNKPSGQITMFTAAGSPIPSQFTVNNSLVAATDTIVLSISSGPANYYILVVGNVSAGSFNINFWTSGGVSSDTPTINFALIKGASA